MTGIESRPAVEAFSSGKRVWQPLILLLLAVLPLAVFGPRLGKEFIYYDDDEYLVFNGAIQHGLTWAGVRWALTTGYAANWHPLTWLSHMADISLFGLNPIAHHAMGLLWHVVNTLFLYLVLRSLTGSSWRSAWVAALFAVHPAHVESVAWAAERKDLLSTTFGLAAMWTYGQWVRERGFVRYLVLLLLYAAGLMSKPMLVSLPVVLLLLDFWPLGRWKLGEKHSWSGLIVEKVPLFLMAAASAVVTFLVQRSGGAVRSLDTFSLPARIGNALVAYAGYLKTLVWPANLAVFYPHPGVLPAWKVLVAALLLAGLSAGACALRRRAPFLIVGWLWFLAALFPVIGVVQVGYQAMADRYTYFPFVGLFVAIAWGTAALASRRRSGGAVLAAAALAVLAAAALGAAAQARFWRNSETLFLHAIAVTKNNSVAQNNLGHYYNETGRPAEALPLLSEAVRIDPERPQNHNNRGVSLFLLGRYDEAFFEFSHALRVRPDDALVLSNLARTRFVQGDIPEAIRLYGAAIVRDPDAADPRGRLAVALLVDGKLGAAVRQLESVSRLSPADADSRQLLADVITFRRSSDDPSLVRFRKFLASTHLDASVALYARGKNPEAAFHLLKAIEVFPAYAAAHNELGARLMREGRRSEAESEFRRALEIEPGLALAHNNLGFVLFLKGQRVAAVEHYREALRLQPEFPLARENLRQALAIPAGK